MSASWISFLSARLFSDILALVWPAYCSFKALRSKRVSEIAQWLMYWIVISLFKLIESVSDHIVYWLPFYYTAKILFVTWLLLPQTKGYLIIYRYIVHPTLKEHENEIDEKLVEVQSWALSGMARFWHWLAERVKQQRRLSQQQIPQDYTMERNTIHESIAPAQNQEEKRKKSSFSMLFSPKSSRKQSSSSTMTNKTVYPIDNESTIKSRKDSERTHHRKSSSFDLKTLDTDTKQLQEMLKNISTQDYLGST